MFFKNNPQPWRIIKDISHHDGSTKTTTYVVQFKQFFLWFNHCMERYADAIDGAPVARFNSFAEAKEELEYVGSKILINDQTCTELIR